MIVGAKAQETSLAGCRGHTVLSEICRMDQRPGPDLAQISSEQRKSETEHQPGWRSCAPVFVQGGALNRGCHAGEVTPACWLLRG